MLIVKTQKGLATLQRETPQTICSEKRVETDIYQNRDQYIYAICNIDVLELGLSSFNHIKRNIGKIVVWSILQRRVDKL